jgi:hypothetical protein
MKNKELEILYSSGNEEGGNLEGNRPSSRRNAMRYILGALIGGVAGFAYYKLVGCSTGTCPLTSNPWISTVYGMAMGSLAAGSMG